MNVGNVLATLFYGMESQCRLGLLTPKCKRCNIVQKSTI